jgi:hypothetical protein
VPHLELVVPHLELALVPVVPLLGLGPELQDTQALKVQLEDRQMARPRSLLVAPRRKACYR